MGLITTIAGALVVWIVLWAIGTKGFDAFLVALAISLVGAAVHMLSGYVSGRRNE